MPLVTVIMPVFNAERFVAAAVQSVLNQGVRDVEIVCVDDGSTDGSARLVQSFGGVVRYVWQPNQGPTVARNTGLGLVRSPFVTFLDNDDAYPDYKLTRQLALFDQEPDLEVVFGKTQYEFLDGSSPERFRFPDESRTVWNVLLGAGLYRTEVFRKVGLFNPTLPIADDFDWFNRAKELGVRMRATDEVMLHYRHHGSNYTREHEQVKTTLMQMLKLSLDRRREGGGDVRPLPQFADYQRPSDAEPSA